MISFLIGFAAAVAVTVIPPWIELKITAFFNRRCEKDGGA